MILGSTVFNVHLNFTIYFSATMWHIMEMPVDSCEVHLSLEKIVQPVMVGAPSLPTHLP